MINNKNIIKTIMPYIRVIILAIVLSFIVKTFFIMSMDIPSGSMETTIMTGDYVMGNRLAYINKDPERGDIVAFLYPVDGKTLYIKRIIGLPGEEVKIKKGVIYINGHKLKEDYITGPWGQEEEDLSYMVPEGSYFMMGDNRDNSSDSRYWPEEALMADITDDYNEALSYGFVKKENIKAKAVFSYMRAFKIFKSPQYNLTSDN